MKFLMGKNLLNFYCQYKNLVKRTNYTKESPFRIAFVVVQWNSVRSEKFKFREEILNSNSDCLR